MIKQIIVVLVAGVVIVSCRRPTSEETLTTHGMYLSYMDTTVNPADNFFNYVNGTWLAQAEIPASQGAWGAFRELRDQSLHHQKNSIEELLKKNNPSGSLEQKLADLYTIAMDSTRNNKEGVSILQLELDKISQAKTVKDVIEIVPYLHRIGCDVFWRLAVLQDLKRSDHMALYISQGGIGMPDPDYYLNKDRASLQIQHAYRGYIKNMLHFFMSDSIHINQRVEIIYTIEKRLAKMSMNTEKQLDYKAQYNKMTLHQLAALTPLIDWNSYFKKLGIDSLKEVIVSQPLFMKEVNKELAALKLEDLKIYITWQVIHSYALFINDGTVRENFLFYKKTLNGVKEMQPRWKIALARINDFMGNGLGQLYVKNYFSEKAKQKINKMVDDLASAFEEQIQQLDWMSDSTKQQALIKLRAMGRKLGYPDKWEDYSLLYIDKHDSYVKNIVRIHSFWFDKNIAKLYNPVDKLGWGDISPQTVNAFYDPSLNQIMFPAAIIQPPFFSMEADEAVNYGAMVASNIGHEMVHAFDDLGSQFDAQGNMRNWWTKEDRQKFDEKTQKLVDQYNQFIAIDTLHVNGKLTLGENIADLGGLIIGYKAFLRALKNGKINTATIAGFTPEQRFFIGYAQSYKEKQRPELLRSGLMTDVHSPEEARVNIPLSNMPEFYKAFHVKPSNKMYREDKDKVKIW